MKRSHPSRAQLRLSCAQVGPDDGADPRFDVRPANGARMNRKSLQLCHEVARVLEQVLTWETGDDRLTDLRIESVVPAPSTARLLVVISAPAGLAVADVLEVLQRRSGQLRAEVASSVRRRRAPELAFQVVPRR